MITASPVPARVLRAGADRGPVASAVVPVRVPGPDRAWARLRSPAGKPSAPVREPAPAVSLRIHSSRCIADISRKGDWRMCPSCSGRRCGSIPLRKYYRQTASRVLLFPSSVRLRRRRLCGDTGTAALCLSVHHRALLFTLAGEVNNIGFETVAIRAVFRCQTGQ